MLNEIKFDKKLDLPTQESSDDASSAGMCIRQRDSISIAMYEYVGRIDAIFSGITC